MLCLLHCVWLYPVIKCRRVGWFELDRLVIERYGIDRHVINTNQCMYMHVLSIIVIDKYTPMLSIDMASIEMLSMYTYVHTNVIDFYYRFNYR